jgi:DNA-binding SARP family transcriptional activator/tetratricopeptide (TPR) repeat protein
VLDGRSFAGRQVRLAFAYLVAHRRSPVPHDELAEALWPGHPPPSWQRTLSVIATRVRAALADLGLSDRVLTSAQGCFHLDLPADTHIDVDEALATVEEAEAAVRSADWALVAERSQLAVELLRRPFLPGDEGTWVEQIRGVRRDLLMRALDAAVQAAVGGDHHARAVALAQEAVELDPFREAGCRQLVRALAAVGDRARALQVYERCRRLLADELGVSPSADTEAVYLEVLREDRARPATSPQQQRAATVTGEDDVVAEAAVDLSGLTPFVGRERERAELTKLMERAAAGRGALLMLGGEPGVGKSRLCQEVTVEAQRCGFLVRTGHCYEGQGDLPYTPWVEMVEAAAREAPADVFRATLGDAAAELARMVPQLRRMFPDIPPPLDLPPEQQRRYMFSSLADYIARLASSQPRLYVLEDLHWADDSTLLFLRYLAERLPSLPILVLATYRDPPIDITPLLAEMLSSCVRSPHAHLLTVSRHSELEVADLLQSLSGHLPPPAVTAAFYAETEGNAFFVEELFRHLAETGRMLDETGNFRADLRVDELDVPRNVRLVTGRRLDRLGETTRRLLTVGAVIGRRFEFGLVRAVAGFEEQAVLNALEEGERAGLVFTESVGPTTHIWFTHELVRQSFLAEASTLRRQRYHLRVADALERLHADDLAMYAADIAHHLVRASDAADPLRTSDALAQAGHRALDATAFEEAMHHYDQALSILPGAQEHRRADLLCHLARAHRSLSHWDEALTAWEAALTIYEAVGERHALAALCWDLGIQLLWPQRFHEALRMAERGLAAGSELHRADILTVRGMALAQAGDFEDAEACIEEAKGLALAAGDQQLLGRIDFAETVQYYCSMRFEQILEPGRRATEALRRAGAQWELAGALPFLSVGCVLVGRFEEADVLTAELEPLAQRLGHSAAAAAGRLASFVMQAAQTADLDTLEALSTAHMRMAQDTDSRYFLAQAHTLRGIVDLWRGEWVDTRRAMLEGARLATPGFAFGSHHGFLCLLLALEGRGGEAFNVLDDVADRRPHAGRASTLGQWNLALLGAEAAGLLMDTDPARRHYPMVVAALATGALMRQYDGGLLQRVAGMAAAAAGLHEQAEQHFETALQQSETLPHLMERPQVRHFYADFLLGRDAAGDRERAVGLLTQAVLGYHSIGMPRHEAMAQRLLAQAEAGTRR